MGSVERAGTCEACLEPLGDHGWQCPACGLRLHRACRQRLAGCPSAGCARRGAEEGPSRRPPASVPPRPARRGFLWRVLHTPTVDEDGVPSGWVGEPAVGFNALDTFVRNLDRMIEGRFAALGCGSGLALGLLWDGYFLLSGSELPGWFLALLPLFPVALGGAVAGVAAHFEPVRRPRLTWTSWGLAGSALALSCCLGAVFLCRRFLSLPGFFLPPGDVAQEFEVWSALSWLAGVAIGLGTTVLLALYALGLPDRGEEP
ncbi:MAG: hypothetical protein D6731_00510 [Planctomycetota bacterium]|nr:MAG: hypothetical protein D6731_00510 [Planctomycetota bacterium]